MVIRTLVTLDESEYELVKKEAKALGISAAEFIRRAIRESLPMSPIQPWMRYAGMVESGNPRSNQSIDELVYGAKH